MSKSLFDNVPEPIFGTGDDKTLPVTTEEEPLVDADQFEDIGQSSYSAVWATPSYNTNTRVVTIRLTLSEDPGDSFNVAQDIDVQMRSGSTWTTAIRWNLVATTIGTTRTITATPLPEVTAGTYRLIVEEDAFGTDKPSSEIASCEIIVGAYVYYANFSNESYTPVNRSIAVDLTLSEDPGSTFSLQNDFDVQRRSGPSGSYTWATASNWSINSSGIGLNRVITATPNSNVVSGTYRIRLKEDAFGTDKPNSDLTTSGTNIGNYIAPTASWTFAGYNLNRITNVWFITGRLDAGKDVSGSIAASDFRVEVRSGSTWSTSTDWTITTRLSTSGGRLWDVTATPGNSIDGGTYRLVLVINAFTSGDPATDIPSSVINLPRRFLVTWSNPIYCSTSSTFSTTLTASYDLSNTAEDIPRPFFPETNYVFSVTNDVQIQKRSGSAGSYCWSRSTNWELSATGSGTTRSISATRLGGITSGVYRFVLLRSSVSYLIGQSIFGFPVRAEPSSAIYINLTSIEEVVYGEGSSPQLTRQQEGTSGLIGRGIEANGDHLYFLVRNAINSRFSTNRVWQMTKSGSRVASFTLTRPTGISTTQYPAWKCDGITIQGNIAYVKVIWTREQPSGNFIGGIRTLETYNFPSFTYRSRFLPRGPGTANLSSDLSSDSNYLYFIRRSDLYVYNRSNGSLIRRVEIDGADSRIAVSSDRIYVGRSNEIKVLRKTNPYPEIRSARYNGNATPFSYFAITDDDILWTGPALVDGIHGGYDMTLHIFADIRIAWSNNSNPNLTANGDRSVTSQLDIDEALNTSYSLCSDIRIQKRSGTQEPYDWEDRTGLWQIEAEGSQTTTRKRLKAIPAPSEESGQYKFHIRPRSLQLDRNISRGFARADQIGDINSEPFTLGEDMAIPTPTIGRGTFVPESRRMDFMVFWTGIISSQLTQFTTADVTATDSNGTTLTVAFGTVVGSSYPVQVSGIPQNMTGHISITIAAGAITGSLSATSGCAYYDTTQELDVSIVIDGGNFCPTSRVIAWQVFITGATTTQAAALDANDITINDSNSASPALTETVTRTSNTSASYTVSTTVPENRMGSASITIQANALGANTNRFAITSGCVYYDTRAGVEDGRQPYLEITNLPTAQVTTSTLRLNVDALIDGQRINIDNLRESDIRITGPSGDTTFSIVAR